MTCGKMEDPTSHCDDPALLLGESREHRNERTLCSLQTLGRRFERVAGQAIIGMKMPTNQSPDRVKMESVAREVSDGAST